MSLSTALLPLLWLFCVPLTIKFHDLIRVDTDDPSTTEYSTTEYLYKSSLSNFEYSTNAPMPVAYFLLFKNVRCSLVLLNLRHAYNVF